MIENSPYEKQSSIEPVNRAIDDAPETTPDYVKTSFSEIVKSNINNYPLWIAKNTDNENKSGGYEAWLFEEEDVNDFIRLDVGVKEYLNYVDVEELIKEISGLLPDNSVRDGFLKAVYAKTMDLLAAARLARTNPDFNFKKGDIETALIDEVHLLSAISAVLGSEDVCDDCRTKCIFKENKKNQNGGSRGVYEINSERLMPAKFNIPFSKKLSERMILKDNRKGMLSVSIDPSRRVSFEYTPISDWYGGWHKSETIILSKKFEQTKFSNDGLCLRIDIDETAPEGIALDLGRSEYDAKKSDGFFSRTGDLLGNIFSEVSPNGCHEYTGFTSEMKNDFRAFAEELAVKQHLRWADQQQGAQTVA